MHDNSLMYNIYMLFPSLIYKFIVVQTDNNEDSHWNREVEGLKTIVDGMRGSTKTTEILEWKKNSKEMRLIKHKFSQDPDWPINQSINQKMHEKK